MPATRPMIKRSRNASREEVILGEHLADLRSRVRLLTWISGLCWTTIVLLGGLLVSGTLDWLIHFDDTGTRLLIGLALVGGSGWMLWRQLVAPLRLQLSGAFLAARVEHRFPGLNSRVLSAVEFLDQRLDQRVGSPELQQAVVGLALNDMERIEASDVIDITSIRNVMIGSAFIAMIAALTTVAYPLEAVTSVERLMLPFAKVPWPRNVELQLIKPDLSPVDHTPGKTILIARGDTLELYAENKRGRLPDRVWIEYRTSQDGPIVREPLRQTTLRDEKGRSHETAAINWVATTRGTMQFRVTGGDDNVMPFHEVEVVPPPAIQSLQVTVTPPAYLRRPVEFLPPGVGHVQGYLGTRIDVIATSDKSLAFAKLRIGEQPAATLAVDSGGHQFSASFEIKDAHATNYWFELTDTQGFSDREAVRYELRGIPDGVPDISIELPVADVILTVDAELPVKILAKDDLGLKDIRITYEVGDAAKQNSISLFDRETSVSEDSSSENASERTGLLLGPQRREVNYVWKMSDLNPEPGTRIVFRAEATDDYNIGEPHRGRSIPRTITIVSKSDKQKELAARVGDLLDDLKQATQLQQRARQQTKELQSQLENVGELRTKDLDQLGRAELDQRQTASQLTHPADGVESQARQLLEEFRGNHLSDAGTEERLERLTNELSRLSRDVLPEAERALTQAQKLAEQSSTNSSEDRNGSQSTQTPPTKSGERTTDKSQDPSTAEKKPTMPEGGTSMAPQKTRQKGDSSVEKETAQTAEPVAQTDKAQGGVRESSTESAMQGESSPTENTQSSGQETANHDPTKSEKSAQTNDEKSGKPQSAAEKNLNSALAEAEAQQAQSLETLNDLQDSLAEWRDRRDVSRDLDSVIAEQDEIQKKSAEMAQRTMTKSNAELSNQEKAELEKLSSRQTKVAEQLEQFQKELKQTAGSIQKNDPDSAEKFNDAGQQLNDQATASTLQQAAEEIKNNKLGAAAEAQQKAMEELRNVERMMKRQPNEDTEQFLKQTQEAQKEFQQIRQEQQELAGRAQELASQPDSMEKQEQMQELMEQQAELSERMAKAERKLERLRLHGPAEAAHRARKRLNEMMKSVLDAQDSDETQQAMEEALEELEEVERELVLEKRIAQEKLAFEQLEKIEDELNALRARQEAVVTETIRLDEAKSERGEFGRAQLKSLKDLAETERSLQHSAEQMQQQMASAEIFSLVLKRLGRTLMLASDRLSERETSAPTQSLETEAVRKIDSLLAVLKKEQKKKEQPQQKQEELGEEPQEQEQKPEEAQPPGDTITQLAQLKLLKSLQEEYLERTELLDKFRDKDGKLPESMQAEKDELAHEQAELADFTRNLIAKFLQQKNEMPQEKVVEPKPKEDPKESDPTKIDP